MKRFWITVLLLAGLLQGQETPLPPACAGEPVQREFTFDLGYNVWRQNEPVFEVPAGKRLTVEQVTLFVRLASATGVVGELILGDLEAANITQRFALKTVEGGYQETWYLANTPLRAYARPRQRLYMGIWRQGALGNGVVQGTLTGCLTLEK